MFKFLRFILYLFACALLLKFLFWFLVLLYAFLDSLW